MSGGDRDFHIHQAKFGSAHGGRVHRISIAAGRQSPTWRRNQGSGGIRKLRGAVGSRGKSGGARLIYYSAAQRNVILLLYAYAKSVAADLTPKRILQLSKLVKEELGDETSNV